MDNDIFRAVLCWASLTIPTIITILLEEEVK